MTTYMDIELKNHGFKEPGFLPCQCFVREIIDDNNLSLMLCEEHNKQLCVALKQSIISKSKK